MADNHTPEQRSYNMSRIKSTETKPEALVRKYLFSQGFRYRKNVKNLPGKPDVVLKKYNTCIFVNGCFWHKHEDCKYFVWPKSNLNYWKTKIETNVERDTRNHDQLEKDGWNVLVVWECQLKKENFEKTMEKLTNDILNGGIDNSRA